VLDWDLLITDNRDERSLGGTIIAVKNGITEHFFKKIADLFFEGD
jgi:hypothetical protein